MPESGEWRFTYGVEIDAAQARAAAQALRAIFAEALRDLDVGKALAGQSGAGGGVGAVRSQLSQIETSTQRSQQRLTAITEQEAHERARIERTNTQIALEEARRQRVQAEQEQQRLTASTKAEIKERQAAQHSAAATAASTRQAATMAPLMGASRMVSGLAYGALGAIGMYGLESSARTLYTAGRTGAQQQRIAETFDYLAKRANISADAMTSAIKEASRGTITDMNAMALAAQVLAQKFSGSSEDIVGDTSALVQASRRLSQIYVDKEGNAQTTEQVFSRMIGFVREGNKELVDQFGITNQRIADTLGISVDGLAGAEGAADRFRGIIAILGEEMERLGGATETTADKIEAAEARIANSANRIRAALAGPTAAAAEGAAGLFEDVMMGAGRGEMEHYRQQFRARLSQEGPDTGLGSVSRDLARERAQAALAAIEAYNAALDAGVPNVERYEQSVINLATSAYNGTKATFTLRTESDNLVGALNAATSMHLANADATTEAATATYDAAEAMAELTAELNQANPELSYLITLANQASGSVVGLTGSIEGLTGRLSAFRGMQAGFLGALSSAAGNVTDIAGLQGALDMFATGQGQAFQYSSMLANKQIPPELGLPPGMELTDQTMPIVLAAVEDLLTKPFDDMVEAERERKRLQDKAAREWESAAEKTQRAWESAAEATVKAFESTLESIPGIFGTSDVSEEDMQMAEWGIYEEKPDEYLRQLRDEVRNKKDYEGVDIYDAARRAGIDQGLPQEAILALFERKWENQTLFADKANLELFNPDAVRREFEQKEASKQGRQNILEFFGMDEDIMGDLTAEFQAQLAGQQQQFGAMGGDMAKALFGGYQKSIETEQWFTPIIDTITTQVLETINAQMAAP